MTRPEDLDDTLPMVPFCPFRCDHCGATKPFTYGQKGRIRYHRCKDCGSRYRSFELRRHELATWAAPKKSAPQNQRPQNQ